MGLDNALAISKDGHLYVWGNITNGKLKYDQNCLYVPTKVDYFSTLKNTRLLDVSAGSTFSLVSVEDTSNGVNSIYLLGGTENMI
mmetsp:Transcript_30060/g.29305  ORF Transcript_30060/g.29305 Transcript_30060/m.29305 type:complete len:85 (+) Transcript_30060:5436-5690(+)